MELPPATCREHSIDQRATNRPEEEVGAGAVEHLPPAGLETKDPQIATIGLVVVHRIGPAVDVDPKAFGRAQLEVAAPRVAREDLAGEAVGRHEITGLDGEAGLPGESVEGREGERVWSEADGGKRRREEGEGERGDAPGRDLPGNESAAAAQCRQQRG